MNNSTALDPFKVLGLPKEASESELRARYLELVKQFPPEQDPEKFREIQAAFASAKDPLVIARRMLEPPSEDDPPKWSDAIEEQKQMPPALSPAFLLSLGNREEAYRHGKAEAAPDELANEQDNNEPHQKQQLVEQPHE